MSTITTTVLNALAAAYFGRVAAQGPATLYAAFIYDAVDGIAGGTEVAAAGNYSRTAIVNNQVNFAAPANGVVSNATPIVGPRSTAAWHAAGHPINAVRFYDAAAAGNLIGGAILNPTVTVDATGITITIEAAQLSITLASP
jgi:hypothetical protein